MTINCLTNNFTTKGRVDIYPPTPSPSKKQQYLKNEVYVQIWRVFCIKTQWIRSTAFVTHFVEVLCISLHQTKTRCQTSSKLQVNQTGEIESWHMRILPTDRSWIIYLCHCRGRISRLLLTKWRITTYSTPNPNQTIVKTQDPTSNES